MLMTELKSQKKIGKNIDILSDQGTPYQDRLHLHYKYTLKYNQLILSTQKMI